MFNGEKLKITLFGESHGKCVGVCVEGLPPGVKIDMDYIDKYMQRRRSVNKLTTPRQEKDIPKVISGVYEGFTTGMALSVIIENENTKSHHYTKDIPRPTHSDYTQRMRYGGFSDYRGGGGFSGRLTAPLVFVGALCSYILDKEGITLGVHLSSVHNVYDNDFNKCKISKDLLMNLKDMDMPLLNTGVKGDIIKEIEVAKEKGDSVGGTIEGCVIGIRGYFGGNYFSRLQSKLSSLVFSLPGFCGLEFGGGFSLCDKYGSQVNDQLYFDDQGKIRTQTNNSGGINGGITNTMPIILKAAVRPTPSISIEQNTVDLARKENVKTGTVGRHDPCIVLRGAVCLESVMAIGILDAVLGGTYGTN